MRDGDAVFSPRLAGFVLDAFAGEPPPTVADPELDQLTPREREVLRLIARGYTYKEIARRLSLSVKTVETHVSAVLRKLQLSSRHELTLGHGPPSDLTAPQETGVPRADTTVRRLLVLLASFALLGLAMPVVRAELVPIPVEGCPARR